MDNDIICFGPGMVRKELIRIMIERVQGIRTGDRSDTIPEPEKKSPKVKYGL